MVAALAVGMLAAVHPAPAEAATSDTNAWFLLVNRNSGKALGVPAGSPRTGCTWAFGRCGEWSPRSEECGGACRVSRRGERCLPHCPRAASRPAPDRSGRGPGRIGPGPGPAPRPER
ncbi:hypothetical protein GCM10018793_68010 [Streptomyces sulfonofaciens]|uniref:Uncharacterized protein n=1 Tax=Streptomyces sulfonofaciens TaxID=68272 RepID=A0A919GPL2_9ACTN|nr:hypothetical protein GCM10018793_68010 [Streptomyces sulfonofaciens]